MTTHSEWYHWRSIATNKPTGRLSQVYVCRPNIRQLTIRARIVKVVLRVERLIRAKVKHQPPPVYVFADTNELKFVHEIGFTMWSLFRPHITSDSHEDKILHAIGVYDAIEAYLFFRHNFHIKLPWKD